MSKENFLPSSYNRSLFFISLPLFGLWFFFFRGHTLQGLQKQEDACRIFTLHSLILSYFLVTEIFLFLSIWVVPYFVEPVLWVLIRINVVVTIFLFSLLSAWVWKLPWDWFEKKQVLVIIRDWFFNKS